MQLRTKAAKVNIQLQGCSGGNRTGLGSCHLASMTTRTRCQNHCLSCHIKKYLLLHIHTLYLSIPVAQVLLLILYQSFYWERSLLHLLFVFQTLPIFRMVCQKGVEWILSNPIHNVFWKNLVSYQLLVYIKQYKGERM